ncbi:response regulator transcription factor [Conexibacter woesei]|uniref:Two component transcriptional regulator, LuxR family n=1 Tax=Conexibacter woesei (strain DSM 14684 / CCUG 47730 / CIP 108061 / JCM 11494 / NBRC 100937 / ID131577) TaxID=469383 RepID=D3F7F1_CONWI|nr:response regulator transcription factor [Conexibacter woesei]ADB50813.1 two component transcriptional regulator, LuxR family [Conexibacter woesei DSM 14684]
MRVVIGEDEALLREGLSLVLERAGFEVAALAGDADALVRAVEEERPDLVVTDIRMPPTGTDDGLRAALAIRARLPETAVLVLSQHAQRRYATDLLAQRSAGVGYLLKQRIVEVDAFCDDVRRICAGGTVLDPDLISTLLGRARPDDDPLHGLTARQRDVLALMAEGRSNAAIADRLVITEKAVVKHVSNVYEQLDLPPDAEDHRRVLAVVRYLAQ